MSSSERSSVFCEHCGAALRSQARFCGACGQPQSATFEKASSTGHGTLRAAPSAAQAGTSASSSAATSKPIGTIGALPILAGAPLELWLVIAAFVIPGAWLTFEVLKALPDAFRAMGSEFIGFRIGLALVLVLVLVGLIGVAMLAIAWRLHRRDRVGRGLAYAFGGTIIVAVVFSDARTSAETWAMVFSIAGIAILAFAPPVRELFDRAASPDGVPTSIVVSRTLIVIFCALAGIIAVSYLLLASVKGGYVVAALVAIAAAVLASRWSKRLVHADRAARQALSIGGAVTGILLIALGRSSTGLLFPLGLIVSTVCCLWLPTDARKFFGDQPLSIEKS